MQHILLVEDDPDDVQLIKDALSNSGAIDIIHKKNGLEALTYLKELRVNKSSMPSLIVMDINMPVLNGKEMLAILKNDNEFSFIPVIVFTTSSNEEDRKFCQKFSVKMITKPNGMNAFNEQVQNFMDDCAPSE
jgi:CheY-like chemotaxis protein